jgi:hypothetical protein
MVSLSIFCIVREDVMAWLVLHNIYGIDDNEWAIKNRGSGCPHFT